MATDKKKIALYVNREIWEEFNEILKQKGYPRGVPSWVAQQAFHDLTLQLTHSTSTQLDFFFDRKP